MTKLPSLLAGLAALAAAPAPALGALADFRVNEVFPGPPGSPGLAFVELHVGADTAGNCLFPTTRIEVFDPQGQLLGAVAPFSGTVCYSPGSYFLLTSQEAAAHFGVERDAPFTLPLPAAGGQLCLASSQTRYDCARWGEIGDAVRYLRNTDDASAAPAIPGGVALARVADTGVVSADFVLQSPTPRQPNDGTIWIPPDAAVGPTPDAGAGPDGGSVDARTDFTRPDARPIPRPDANLLDPAFLAADPGGGAACACRAGGRPPSPWLAALLVAAAWLRSRRRA